MRGRVLREAGAAAGPIVRAHGCRIWLRGAGLGSARREEGLARRLPEAREGDWRGDGGGAASLESGQHPKEETPESAGGKVPYGFGVLNCANPRTWDGSGGGWCHRRWRVCVGLVFGSYTVSMERSLRVCVWLPIPQSLSCVSVPAPRVSVSVYFCFLEVSLPF